MRILNAFVALVSVVTLSLLAGTVPVRAETGVSDFPAFTLPTFTLPTFPLTSTTLTTTTTLGVSTTLPPTTLPSTTSTTTSTTSTTSTATSTTTLPERLCGDGVEDGRLTASDALFALRTSVGLAACETCVCDVNASGAVTASDALALLRGAVGGDTAPECIHCPDERVSRADVRALAEAIYEWVERGEVITVDDISGILGLFDIRTIPANDGAALTAALDEKIPFVLDFQVADIASALTAQDLVTVDSLIADLAAFGIEAKDPVGPLTLPHLSEKLSPLAAQQSYSESEILPGLFIALSRERALRKGMSRPDPVWGDGRLDPLQFILLTYSVFFERPQAAQLSTATKAPMTTSIVEPPRAGIVPLPTISKFWRVLIVQKGLGILEYQIGRFLGFPVGPTGSAQVIVCASVIMNSYKMQVSNNPAIISRRATGSAQPYESESKAKLTFQFDHDINSFSQQMILFLSSCEVPENGQAIGKPVSWSLSGELPSHGSLVEQASQTDALGEAKAKYRAKDEVIPKELRTFANQKTATGNVEAKASNLMPDWFNLEKVLAFLKPDSGGQGVGVLQVQYYEPPSLELTLNSRVKNTLGNGFVYESRVQTKVQLPAPKPGPDGTWSPDAKYKGTGNTAYQDFQIVADPDGCQSVAATYGGTARVVIPLGDESDSLSVLVNPGGPRETIRVDCPGDGIGPQDVPATLWTSGWQATHQAERSGGSADYAGEHWKIESFSSGSGPGSLTKSTSKQTSVMDVEIENDDEWLLRDLELAQ